MVHDGHLAFDPVLEGWSRLENGKGEWDSVLIHGVGRYMLHLFSEKLLDTWECGRNST